MQWGRAVHFDPAELAALKASLHPVLLDFDFPPGTRKKIQPSSPGTWPEVDLHSLTCTCERWQQHGEGAPRGSPRRLCRHLLRFLMMKLPAEAHGCLNGLMSDKSSMQLEAVKEVRVAGARLCWVGQDRDAPFMSIYAHARRAADGRPPGSGVVCAYRLSKTGDRWGYGEAPFGAGMIKMALAAVGAWSPNQSGLGSGH